MSNNVFVYRSMFIYPVCLFIIMEARIFFVAGKMSRRALHFVFKIGDRTKTMEFFKNTLGMQVEKLSTYD